METKTKLFSLALIATVALASCTKKPMACCDGPATGTVGQSVSFTSSCSMDASKYEWDFGDGSAVSKDATASHVYTTAGTYTVKLMAMSKNEKKMSETTKTIIIN